MLCRKFHNAVIARMLVLILFRCYVKSCGQYDEDGEESVANLVCCDSNLIHTNIAGLKDSIFI